MPDHLFLSGKGSDEQLMPFLFSDPQNLEMLLIGANLHENNSLLVGGNDAALIKGGHVSYLHLRTKNEGIN